MGRRRGGGFDFFSSAETECCLNETLVEDQKVLLFFSVNSGARRELRFFVSRVCVVVSDFFFLSMADWRSWGVVVGENGRRGGELTDGSKRRRNRNTR